MKSFLRENTLLRIYRRLFAEFGPQHWWPGDTAFEIIVGAILTQNTNWGNVEKAIRNLKEADVLTPDRLYRVSTRRLAGLIRPAGYFNVKARRLKNFLAFLSREYGGDLKRMAREPLESLRPKILAVNGIGPETADSILLYALGKPIFVVDAYTRRMLERHGLADGELPYAEIQEFFTRRLKPDLPLFNEYHALIVRLGKSFCKTIPRCDQCPLKDISYSLTSRCSACYRYLPRGKERKAGRKEGGRYVCGRCAGHLPAR